MWTMITRDNCKYCEDAKSLLQEKSQGVTIYNVQTSSSRWLLTLLKKSGVTTVPQVFKPDGSLVGGYSELKELFTEGPL